MEKLILTEVIDKFQAYNSKINLHYGLTTKNKPLNAVIVYKESNFSYPHSLEERSYRIRSDAGKQFFKDMNGKSLWGSCLDGKDPYARLDLCNWEIEYCYLEDDS